MVDAKTIGISSLIALGIVLSSMLIPGLFDDPQYYCESRPELGLISCDTFSKYVASNGKCIREFNTNLICRDGWLLVTDDRSIPDNNIEPPIIETPIIDKPIIDNDIESNVVTGKQYSCSPIKCTKIN